MRGNSMNLHQQHLIEDATGRDLTEDEIESIGHLTGDSEIQDIIELLS